MGCFNCVGGSLVRIAGNLLFDFSTDGVAKYLEEVILDLIGAFGDAVLSIWNSIWSRVVEPFVQGDLIDNGFWIGFLMIWLVSTMVIVNKTFGWSNTK